MLIKTLKKLAVVTVFVCTTSVSLIAYDTEDFVVVKNQNDTVESKEAGTSDTVFEKIAAVAKNLIGIKYKFGGTAPSTGFDCSGFVNYVFNEGAGLKLPRGSRDMRTVGRAVDLKSLKPGDLLFFKLHSSHVAIYVGENRFVHAPRTGRSVTIDSLLDSNFADKIIGARRIVDME
jgi:cell wall-associated NlpC family hydrolase